MSLKNLGFVLFSGFLIFATAPTAPALSSHETGTRQQTDTTHKGTASKTETHSKDATTTQKDSMRDSGTTTEKSATTMKTTKGGKSAMHSKNRVRAAQTALKDQGFNPGPVDGIKGPKTTAALRAFQTRNGLVVTGSLDEPTVIALHTPAKDNAAQSSNYRQESKPDQNDMSANEQQSERSKPGMGTQDRNSTQTNMGKVDKDARDRSEKAAEVLLDLTSAPDKSVPNGLLDRAKAIAVIPHVIKGAFGVGGRYGKGVVARRLENGSWSAPAFVEIGGGSFGLQLGASSTDLCLVFTDDKALSMITGGKDLKLGVDASVAAGPVGRSAEAGVNQNLGTAVYAYSRAKGLFAGIALDGAVLSLDKDTTEKAYGKSVSAEQVLAGKIQPNATVRPFMDALDRVAPKKRISQR